MLRKKEKYLIILISVIFILLIGITIFNRPSTNQPLMQAINFELPVINEQGLTGDTISLLSFKGKPILLEFAVSWCPHCKNMAPIIKKIYENYAGKGLIVITVMLSYKSSIDETAKFIKEHQSNWIHVFDTKNIYLQYKVEGTPTYFIIDKDFNIKHKLEGEQSYNTLENLIKEIL